MNTKPTPAPWQRFETYDSHTGPHVWIDNDADNWCVAEVCDNTNCTNAQQANTDLIVTACNAAQEANPENPIAAAHALPVLLAALQRSLDWLASYPGGGANAAYDQARAAIAQAEGWE